MPAGNFTFGRGYQFDDTVLASAGQVQTSKELAGDGRTFVPQGVWVNPSSDEDEETLGTAVITGWLIGEHQGMAKAFTVYTKTAVPLAFAGVLSTGTTARGIFVGSEF